MTLTAPAIIGIVGLFLASIPGVRYIWRKIRRKLYSPRKQQPSSRTILPLSGYSSPNLGQLGGRGPDDLTAPGFQGFVTVSMCAAVLWPAGDHPPHRGDRSMSRTMYHHE